MFIFFCILSSYLLTPYIYLATPLGRVPNPPPPTPVLGIPALRITCTFCNCPLCSSDTDLSGAAMCRQVYRLRGLTDEENHIEFWHLSKLWTGKSDKSSKIINPQSVRLSSNSMLNLTKGRRSMWALQPSAKGVTGVVSHYSSYPASFREFLAPDAPEHSLLVNTSLALIPTCTFGHTCTHTHTSYSSLIYR